MKEIGEFLKQKRLEKGITIEEIVDKTRMPITRVKAIEEGDITAFKDDITYLQFFIQSYCRAIGADYTEIKEQLNDSISGYTVSFQSEQLRAQIETEKHIREKSSQRIEEYKIKNPMKKVERKIDFSMISFAAVIVIILVCLLTVGGSYIKDMFDQPDKPVDTPVVDKDDKPQINQPDTGKDEVVKEIEIVMDENDAKHYTILNVEEKVVLKVEFASNSWFQASLDGIVQAKPESKVYDAGQSVEIELDPTKVEEVMMRFGYFAGLKISVGDKELPIDSSISNYPGVLDLKISIGGIENEFTE